MDRKPSEPFRKASSVPSYISKEFGTVDTDSKICRVPTLHDVGWSHGSISATGLWGALERADGRELNTFLCIECSADSYDDREP